MSGRRGEYRLLRKRCKGQSATVDDGRICPQATRRKVNMAVTAAKLAINGGDAAITADPGDMFEWPIITTEDEEAVLAVLRRRSMSGNDVTLEFEKAFAQWHGLEHATDLGWNAMVCTIQHEHHAGNRLAHSDRVAMGSEQSGRATGTLSVG